MFAVGTSFAADENVTLSQADDEITVDNNVLSVEETEDMVNVEDNDNGEIVGESNIVTNATFHNYFDENGTILDTVTDEELIFEGNFTGIDVDCINIIKSIKLTGKNAIFNGVSLNINANNVVIDGFDLTQESSYLLKMEDVANVTISNSIINFKAVQGDNYAIYANCVDNLKILNNNITYVSTYSTKKYNNVIRVEGDSGKGASKNILVDMNNFNISMPSIAIGYDYANLYNAIPYSEGIKFVYCEDVQITNNKIDLKYNATSSGRNTISAIAVNSIFVKADYDEDEIFVEKFYWNISKNILIKHNEINALGSSDIFGISLSADNFEISDNKLNITADETYAAAISFLSAACNGNVTNNNLSAYSPSDVYVIYSADSFLYYTADQRSNIENITYKDNTMYGAASLTCGMELFESYSTISNNVITLEGNYTWGIVQSDARNSVISGNTINSLGFNSAKVKSGDPILPSNSMGISIKGSALVENNDILSTDIGINLVESGDVVINNNRINVIVTNETKNNYAIYAVIDSLNITNNKITFKGKSNGTVASDAIYVSGVDGVVISNNELNVTVTAGEGSAINVENSENIILTENKISYDCEGYVNYGSNNVITVGYASNNAIISNNNIVASGSTYTYGIFVASSNFTVEKNKLNITSDTYYACGISINPGLIKGLVKDNTIDVKAQSPGYGIYSFGYEYGGFSAYSKDISYEDNVITVNAYLANPIQLCEDNSHVYNNKLYAYGNLTCGIFDKVSNNGKATILNNTIVSIASEIHSEATGDGYLTNESVSSGIDASGNVLIQGNDITSSAIGVELVMSGNSTVADNEINVVAANEAVDNYGLSAAGIESLNVTGNNITFTGKSNGNASSRALFISGIDDAIVANNTFLITIPSCGYSYAIFDNPAKGVVFSNAAGLTFDNNNVYLQYSERIGVFDTVNVVEIGYGSDNAIVTNNNVLALGADYIYGIKVYGKNFNISQNNLTISSDVNYANGINPEAGATGIVENNTIVVIGMDAAYPIYSGMYGDMGNLDVDYIGNQIYGNAYYVVAVELGGANENVINNTITAEGNYTIGIGSNSENNTISGNTIKSLGNSIGNQSVSDNFGLVTTGVKILKANAEISNNSIEATNADYAVDLNGTDSKIDNNYLVSKKSVGTGAIANPGSGAVIANVTPSLKTVLFADDATCVYKDGSVYYVKALDENGDPIYNITLQAKYGSTYVNATTNAKGIAEFSFELDAGEHDITFTFYGDKVYGPKTATAHISVDKKPSALTASNKSLLVTATKSGVNYQIVLKDNSGNVLASKKVTVNGQEFTTDNNGVVNYKFLSSKAGTQQLTINFAGDDNYAASTATATIKVNKEAVKITTKKKTFKAKVKTKKYSVTVKDSKGKAIKGLKVTLKVKGKKYTAKTNAKGKATFKIKNLKKKGTYTAKVNFAGNDLYNKAAKSVKIKVKK